MSCNCCVGEPDPNFITADINSKIGEIYAALIASGAVDLVISSYLLDDSPTDDLTLLEGTWRYVRAENYSDPAGANLDGEVNGIKLPAGTSIEYNVPYGHLNVPQLVIKGNADGVRVDVLAW